MNKDFAGQGPRNWLPENLHRQAGLPHVRFVASDTLALFAVKRL
jgi:hypothetical protein